MPPHYSKLIIDVDNVTIGTTMATNRLIQVKPYHALIVHWLMECPQKDC